ALEESRPQAIIEAGLVALSDLDSLELLTAPDQKTAEALRHDWWLAPRAIQALGLLWLKSSTQPRALTVRNPWAEPVGKLLVSALWKRDDATRDAAIEVLRRFPTWLDPLPVVMDTYRQRQNLGERSRLIDALGQVGRDRALPYLRQILEDRGTKIRMTVV